MPTMFTPTATRTFTDRLKGLPRPFVAAACLLMTLLIGVLDYLTGTEVSVATFYLAPVGLAAWLAGRGTGQVVSFVSMAVWLAADVLGRDATGAPEAAVWNAFMLEVAFVAVTLLVAAVRENAESLTQAVAALESEVAEREAVERQLRQANAVLSAAAREPSAADSRPARTSAGTRESHLQCVPPKDFFAVRCGR